MPWDTDDSSGLLAHFIGTVDESTFTTDAQRQDPNKPFLLWHVSVEDVLQQNFQGEVPESVTINLSIGNGWVDDESGESVEHKEGLEMFKGSSLYGKVINLVAGKAKDLGNNAQVMDGDGDVHCDMTGVGKYMQANGYDDPRQAGIWKGLTFEFRGVGFTYRDSKGDPFQNVIPVKFVGEGVSEASKTAKPSPKKASADDLAKEAIDTVPIWLAATADDDTAQTLNDLANSAKNHSEFAKNALLLDGVKNNDDVRNAVMDTANFPS